MYGKPTRERVDADSKVPDHHLELGKRLRHAELGLQRGARVGQVVGEGVGPLAREDGPADLRDPVSHPRPVGERAEPGAHLAVPSSEPNEDQRRALLVNDDHLELGVVDDGLLLNQVPPSLPRDGES